MAKKRLVEVKLNRKGVKRVLKEPAVLTYVIRKAMQMQDAAGGAEAGYDVVSALGRNRARAAVVAYSYDARRDNARRNTLINSIDAARSDF